MNTRIPSVPNAPQPGAPRSAQPNPPFGSPTGAALSPPTPPQPSRSAPAQPPPSKPPQATAQVEVQYEVEPSRVRRRPACHFFESDKFYEMKGDLVLYFLAGSFLSLLILATVFFVFGQNVAVSKIVGFFLLLASFSLTQLKGGYREGVLPFPFLLGVFFSVFVLFLLEQ